MFISGLVITLKPDPELADQAFATLSARPEFVLCGRQGRWLPAAMDTSGEAESRDLHEGLCTLSGVEFVDVAYIHFDADNTAEIRQPR